MASKTEILNMALGHLAIGTTVDDIETERSEAANVGRRFYDIALDAVTSSFNWPFLTRIEALALIEKVPNSEWGFSYKYPANCMGIVRFLSGVRNDTRQSKSPYKMAGDSSGRLIFSDNEGAWVEYTVRANQPDIYPPEFTLTISFYLAGLMAPALTVGDRNKLGDRAFRLYEYTVNKARAKAYNEQQGEEEPESEFIRARR